MSALARNSRNPNAAPSPSSSSVSTSASASASNSSSPSSAAGSTLASADSKPDESRTQKYLTNCKSLYSCIHCRTHLANHDELVSRSFQGNHGRAYLFNSVINITCGPAVQRQLNTGSHAVADIFCSNCERVLGWKYEKAYVETQKYKEGKYIIELAHVVRENRHLEIDKGEIFLSRQLSGKSKSKRYNNNAIMKLNLSSLSYQSSTSPMSSPTDSAIGTDLPLDVNDDDDDDDELMFPFYDDLCSTRSSYPGNLSMSHHDRARRSLYLESKPYDWKNSPRMRSTTTDSALSSNDLPSPVSPSESCHYDEGVDDGEDRNQDVCQSTKCSSKANKRPKYNYGYNNNADNNRFDSETQFKLDDDPPQQEVVQVTARLNQHQQNTADAIGEASASCSCGGNGVVTGSMEQWAPDDNDQPSSSRYTINLDEEEFFDCFSEHDISNTLSWSDGHQQTSS